MAYRRQTLASILFLAFLGVLAAGSDDSGSGGKTASTPRPPCATDWRKCSSNQDMVDNYNGMAEAKVACKSAANKRAKFDTDWPWLPFDYYTPGDDAVKTGRLILVEKEAKFQNGFGAWQKMNIACEYDLAAKAVVNVSIQ